MAYYQGAILPLLIDSVMFLLIGALGAKLVILLLLTASLRVIPTFVVSDILVLPRRYLGPSVLATRGRSSVCVLFNVCFPFLATTRLSAPFVVTL